MGGRGVSIDRYKSRREYAGGKAEFPHREGNQGDLRAEATGCENAPCVAWFSRGTDEFVNIGGNLLHPLEDGIERRSGFEVVPGNYQLRTSAKRRATSRDHFGGFHLDIDGAGTLLDRAIEDAQLVLDTAVEFAVILMPTAGGENGAVGIALQEFRDGARAQSGIAKIVEGNSRKFSPASASRRACSRRRGTSGRPSAMQIFGRARRWVIFGSLGYQRSTEAYQVLKRE